jgi:beta-phosphoglucomutase-like phosphatase (HAD superfamily)
MTDSIIRTALKGRRAVILDWDGTLADTQDRNYHALSAALAPHHITIDRDWYRHHAGLTIHDLLALVAARAPLPIEHIAAASRGSLLASTRPDTLAPIPSAVALARHARAAGLRCAVASGAASVLVEAGLDVLNLRELFTAAQQAGMRVLLVRDGQLTWPVDTDIATRSARATRI